MGEANMGYVVAIMYIVHSIVRINIQHVKTKGLYQNKACTAKTLN